MNVNKLHLVIIEEEYNIFFNDWLKYIIENIILELVCEK